LRRWGMRMVSPHSPHSGECVWCPRIPTRMVSPHSDRLAAVEARLESLEARRDG
jgi:histone acetyltransferase (RNA polymerase elongator complex component)